MFQAKIQKHQAFEAEVAAHANAIEALDKTGYDMINNEHFASETIQVKKNDNYILVYIYVCIYNYICVYIYICIYIYIYIIGWFYNLNSPWKLQFYNSEWCLVAVIHSCCLLKDV